MGTLGKKLYLCILLGSFCCFVVASCAESQIPVDYDALQNNGPKGAGAPTADISGSEEVAVGTVVTLDGSKSFDPDGDALIYSWALQAPPSSSAMLESMDKKTTRFTADVAGQYLVFLLVNDGNEDSEPYSLIITAKEDEPENKPPSADAGIDRVVETGMDVALDGSKSFDPEGDTLSYSWSLLVKPMGSAASIADPTGESTSFNADKDGVYEARLVVNDGTEASQAAIVKITAVAKPPDNQPPVAKAGMDLSGEVGMKIDLNGDASADPDGDTITFQWSFNAPSDSNAILEQDTSATPSFVPDVAGTYEATLIVNDGKVDSDADTVIITVIEGNKPPVANAGSAQTVVLGQTVNLDGSMSMDPDSDPLRYTWTLEKPATSMADLDDPNASKPAFVADVEGTYTAKLTVNDGSVDSMEASVTITVEGLCVILSEVVEGSSNNKAIELYNCGSNPLPLDSLSLCRISNEKDSTSCKASAVLKMSGMIPAKDVWAICHPSMSQQGQCHATSGVIAFNGDDRLILFLDQGTRGTLDGADQILDAFGQSDTQPTTSIWQDKTYRRCNFTPYDGMGMFDVATYFSEHATDSFDNLKIAPTETCKN